jgi:DNA-directed RNA polymerase subunit F
VFAIKLHSVSLDKLEQAILDLKPEERQRLAVWFEENRRELLGDDSDEMSEEQKAEIIRRRELALAHPELLEPWDGTIERVRERLHEFRRQKASAR